MSLGDSLIYTLLLDKISYMKDYNMMQLISLYRELLVIENRYKYTTMTFTYYIASNYKDIVKDRMLLLSKIYPKTRDIEIFRKDRDACFGTTYMDIFRKTIHNKFFKICITSIDTNPVTLFKRGN